MSNRPFMGAIRSRRDSAGTIPWSTSVLVLAFLSVVPPASAHTRPWFCLPPIFDGGHRLYAPPTPQVLWLELLLRQHELCWRRPASPGELRVVLVGNSAVYGLPLPVAKTAGERLNEHFAEVGIRAHVFVYPYQIRDAIIIEKALAYEPDVILYPVTYEEFIHVPPQRHHLLSRFFDVNYGPLDAMVATPPPGLEEPFALYGRDHGTEGRQATQLLREVGLFVRLAARTSAEAIATHMRPPPHPSATVQTVRPVVGAQSAYDCNMTEQAFARRFREWKAWNVLAYLEELQRTRNIRVLVVHWPIVRQPLGDCYSMSYSNAAVADFTTWLRDESERRGLHYLDVHDLLPGELFMDPLHINADGHRRTAEAIARVLDPMLRDWSDDANRRSTSSSP